MGAADFSGLEISSNEPLSVASAVSSCPMALWFAGAVEGLDGNRLRLILAEKDDLRFGGLVSWSGGCCPGDKSTAFLWSELELPILHDLNMLLNRFLDEIELPLCLMLTSPLAGSGRCGVDFRDDTDVMNSLTGDELSVKEPPPPPVKNIDSNFDSSILVPIEVEMSESWSFPLPPSFCFCLSVGRTGWLVEEPNQSSRTGQRSSLPWRREYHPLVASTLQPTLVVATRPIA